MLNSAARDSSRGVALEQVGPDLYRAVLPRPPRGLYLATVYEKDAGVDTGPTSFGIAVPYSPEYAVRPVATDLARYLTETTGGQILGADQTEEVFAAPIGEYLRIPWIFLALGALGAFCADLLLGNRRSSTGAAS